jgi:hypothetical protein
VCSDENLVFRALEVNLEMRMQVGTTDLT